MFLVTGGWFFYLGRNIPLDSTELLETSSWRMSAPLPSAIYGLKSATLGDTIFVLGMTSNHIYLSIYLFFFLFICLISSGHAPIVLFTSLIIYNPNHNQLKFPSSSHLTELLMSYWNVQFRRIWWIIFARQNPELQLCTADLGGGRDSEGGTIPTCRGCTGGHLPPLPMSLIIWLINLIDYLISDYFPYLIHRMWFMFFELLTQSSTKN